MSILSANDSTALAEIMELRSISVPDLPVSGYDGTLGSKLVLRVLNVKAAPEKPIRFTKTVNQGSQVKRMAVEQSYHRWLLTGCVFSGEPVIILCRNRDDSDLLLKLSHDIYPGCFIAAVELIVVGSLDDLTRLIEVRDEQFPVETAEQLNSLPKQVESGTSDKMYLAAFNDNEGITLAVYPEAYPDKDEETMLVEDASPKGDPEKLRYTRKPWSGLLTTAIDALRTFSAIDCCLDVTTATVDYQPFERADIRSMLKGRFPREIHMYVARYHWSEVPSRREHVKDWISERFEFKEEMLQRFYSPLEMLLNSPREQNPSGNGTTNQERGPEMIEQQPSRGSSMPDGWDEEVISVTSNTSSVVDQLDPAMWFTEGPGEPPLEEVLSKEMKFVQYAYTSYMLCFVVALIVHLLIAVVLFRAPKILLGYVICVCASYAFVTATAGGFDVLELDVWPRKRNVVLPSDGPLSYGNFSISPVVGSDEFGACGGGYEPTSTLWGSANGKKITSPLSIFAVQGSSTSRTEQAIVSPRIAELLSLSIPMGQLKRSFVCLNMGYRPKKNQGEKRSNRAARLKFAGVQKADAVTLLAAMKKNKKGKDVPAAGSDWDTDSIVEDVAKASKHDVSDGQAEGTTVSETIGEEELVYVSDGLDDVVHGSAVESVHNSVDEGRERSGKVRYTPGMFKASTYAMSDMSMTTLSGRTEDHSTEWNHPEEEESPGNHSWLASTTSSMTGSRALSQSIDGVNASSNFTSSSHGSAASATVGRSFDNESGVGSDACDGGLLADETAGVESEDESAVLESAVHSSESQKCSKVVSSSCPRETVRLHEEDDSLACSEISHSEDEKQLTGSARQIDVEGIQSDRLGDCSRDDVDDVDIRTSRDPAGASCNRAHASEVVEVEAKEECEMMDRTPLPRRLDLEEPRYYSCSTQTEPQKKAKKRRLVARQSPKMPVKIQRPVHAPLSAEGGGHLSPPLTSRRPAWGAGKPREVPESSFHIPSHHHPNKQHHDPHRWARLAAGYCAEGPQTHYTHHHDAGGENPLHHLYHEPSRKEVSSATKAKKGKFSPPPRRAMQEERLEPMREVPMVLTEDPVLVEMPAIPTELRRQKTTVALVVVDAEARTFASVGEIGEGFILNDSYTYVGKCNSALCDGQDLDQLLPRRPGSVMRARSELPRKMNNVAEGSIPEAQFNYDNRQGRPISASPVNVRISSVQTRNVETLDELPERESVGGKKYRLASSNAREHHSTITYSTPSLGDARKSSNVPRKTPSSYPKVDSDRGVDFT
ncbi:Lysocardiolipin acyltransferase 1, partial [Perkinsus chesapeaki]